MKINSKDKGKRYEREIAESLRKRGWKARRGFQARGGTEQPDVVSDFPFHIECKHVEALNVWKAYAQACRDAAPAVTPLVVFRKNGERSLVALDWEHFLDWWEEKK